MLLATTLALAACVGAPGRYSPFGGSTQGYGYSRLSTATPAGQGVAILAPLSGPNAERGQALVHAAEVALAVPGSPKLDVRDTTGTAAGAASAAQAAIAAGATFDGSLLERGLSSTSTSPGPAVAWYRSSI